MDEDVEQSVWLIIDGLTNTDLYDFVQVGPSEFILIEKPVECEPMN